MIGMKRSQIFFSLPHDNYGVGVLFLQESLLFSIQVQTVEDHCNKDVINDHQTAKLYHIRTPYNDIGHVVRDLKKNHLIKKYLLI